MDKSFRIVGLGEIVLDIYPNEKFVGGVPTNVAQHIHQIGHDGIIVSRVGKDRAGEYMLEQLQKRQLDTSLIQIDPNHATATVKITLNNHAIPRFTCNRDTAFEYLTYEESLSRLATSAHAVVFSALAQRNPVSYTTIQSFLSDAVQAFKVFDLNIRGWNSGFMASVIDKSLYITDAVKFNESEFRLLKEGYNSEHTADEDFITWLAEKFSLKIVALTKAEKGGLLYSASQFVHVPGINITPVDVTGAGDAFVAAMVLKYLEGQPLREIAAAGNLLSAYVAMHKGAVPKYCGWPDDKSFSR